MIFYILSTFDWHCKSLDIIAFIINLFDCICLMYINDDNIINLFSMNVKA